MPMFDMSSKFNSFYRNEVVLSRDAQSDLVKKKDLNIQRLKDGLKEYNEEKGTDFTIVQTCVQGSMSMSTIVQNEDKDYDIDVAIVFDRDALCGKGALATRNMVADALSRKTKQFKADPVVKTSCVRVSYSEGYHIDFAVYRRHYDQWSECWVYEHAGAEWSNRDLTGITEWFKDENEFYDDKLREVTRLSKMFCKSREKWKMPSGLIQTVLCDEQIDDQHDRIDESFYYTMKNIKDRLELYKDVNAPVDNNRSLTARSVDKNKVTQLYNRLKSKLEDLDILFQDQCTEDDAMQAWYGFFNHEFWNEQTETALDSMRSMNERFKSRHFDDEEEFIEDLYPYVISYKCHIQCDVWANGFRRKPLNAFLSVLQKFIPQGFTINCKMEATDCPFPYKVLWKVKNVGPVAERRNQLRGQIFDRGNSITEHTNFYGNHYIECYIIKDNCCVARDRVEIPISWR